MNNICIDYKNHYYLSGKNAGFSQRFVGKVKFITVLIEFSDRKWNNKDYKMAVDSISEAQSTLLSESEKYHVHLAFDDKKYRVELKDFLPEHRDSIDDYILKTVNQIGYKNVFDMLKNEKLRSDCDEVLLIFCINIDMRSYAYMSHGFSDNEEYAVVFFDGKLNKRTIMHESMHVFGALDYYFPDCIDEISKIYLPNSIMNGGMEFDDLTRYVIGWDEDLTNNALLFLEKSKHVTKDYVRSEQKKINNGENQKIYGNRIKGANYFKNINIFERKIKRSKFYSKGLLQELNEYDRLGNIVYSKRRMNNNTKMKWSWCFVDNTYNNDQLVKADIEYYSDDKMVISKQIIKLFYNSDKDLIKQEVYTYDNNGTRTDVIHEYIYDKWLNLRTEIVNGKKIKCNRYDDDNRVVFQLLYKNDNSTEEKRYVYNDYNMIIEEEKNGVITKYSYTLESNKLYKHRQNEHYLKSDRIYVLDVQGNCVEILNGNDNVICEYEYYY